MKHWILALAMGCSMIAPAFAWDLWEDFKGVGIENGRVVDYSDDRAVTTSEGQSYGMFFALVDGDKESFASLLKWTEDNLSSGDITKELPSRFWGRSHFERR